MSGLNTAQLTAFVSTNKLNVAQASLALRAAGVSREQRIQILTNAGLITSNGALTVSLKSVTAALLAQAKAWAATPMGMATIAAAAIFAIVKAVDYFSSASERAAEELANLESEFEELQNKITDASNEFKTLRSSAETVIPRFAELAQGVDAFGNNVSLTDEEYKEFLSLNNQIAEMFPEINMGMNSNGNAMLALSYTADTLADSLWGVVEAERATTNKEISDTMPDVISNIEDTVGLYKDKIADLSSIQAKYFDTYVDFKNQVLKTKFSSNEAKEIANIAKELGINYKMDLKRGDRRTTYYQVEWDYSSLDDDEFLKELETNFNAAMQKYDKPEDYVYTETEVLQYSTLDARIRALENSVDGTGGCIYVGDTEPTDPNVGIWIDTSEDLTPPYIPNTMAKPGQIVRVVAVDENGMVTAVEAVDMPSGGNYELSAATAETLGGVKAEPVTEDDTQPVRIGEDGMLYTKPDSGGGDKWETIVDYTVPEDCVQVFLKTDINGNPFKLKEAVLLMVLHPLESGGTPTSVRCTVDGTVDGTVNGVYNANHYTHGFPGTPEAGKYTYVRMNLVSTPNGVWLREYVYNNNGTADANGLTGGQKQGIHENIHIDTLQSPVKEISAVGLGSYGVAVGKGTRIVMVGVRE